MSFDDKNLDDTQTRRLDGAAHAGGASCADGVDRGPGVDLGTTDPNAVVDPLAAPGPYDAFDPYDSPSVLDPYAPVDSFAGSGAGMRGTSAPTRHIPWGGDAPQRDQPAVGAPGNTAPQAPVRPEQTVVNPYAAASDRSARADTPAAGRGAVYGAAGHATRPAPPVCPAPAPRADGQGGYDYNSLYEDPAAAKAPAVREARAARQDSRQAADEPPRPPHRGASALRWVARLGCLGMLVFGIMAISSLTEQTVGETSSLSSSAQQLANKGAYLVETGQSPTREEDPVKWLGERILLLSVKLSNHGVDIRHQAHTLQFALMGGVVALNVLAWMSGWAHARSSTGQIRSWRSLLMLVLSVAGCAAVSFTDQYHKLYVPGRHFDNLDLVFDAAGYLPAVLLVFTVWSVGSSVYRLVFRK